MNAAASFKMIEPCDYVINAWLVEMEVGRPPAFGLLLDPELKGLSAEAVYDRIVGDLRRMRKLSTFRGAGVGDMLAPRNPRWWQAGEGVALDEFYRNCLAQGLLLHREQCRGLLPAGLVEEIEAPSQPSIPWDVELAQQHGPEAPGQGARSDRELRHGARSRSRPLDLLRCGNLRRRLRAARRDRRPRPGERTRRHGPSPGIDLL